MSEPNPWRLEVAYADMRDDRMIIVGGGEFDTIAQQEAAFDALPEQADSPFIVDFYDETGAISKDKCVPEWAVESVLGNPIADLIEDGRRREDDLGRQLQAMLKSRRQDPSQ